MIENSKLLTQLLGAGFLVMGIRFLTDYRESWDEGEALMGLGVLYHAVIYLVLIHI